MQGCDALVGLRWGRILGWAVGKKNHERLRRLLREVTVLAERESLRRALPVLPLSPVLDEVDLAACRCHLAAESREVGVPDEDVLRVRFEAVDDSFRDPALHR